VVLTIPARMRQTFVVSHRVTFFFLGRNAKVS
jgi:hypothetical protein